MRRSVILKSRRLRFASALLFCIVLEVFGALAFVQDRMTDWWPLLDHPDWAPPLWAWLCVGFLFNVVGTIVIYRTSGAWAAGRSAAPLAAIVAVVFANQLWSGAFFGLESPLAGFAALIPYAMLVAWAFLVLWRADRCSALLFSPYLPWLVFDLAWAAHLADLL